MSGTAIPDTLVAAYRNTDYRVISTDAPFALRIGQRSDELARLLVRTGQQGATFITAENPFSQTVTVEENAANQARLQKDLEKLGATVLKGAGEGQEQEWPAEASFLAIGISRAQACDLGRKYRQNAIIWIDAGAIPQLLLLT